MSFHFPLHGSYCDGSAIGNRRLVISVERASIGFRYEPESRDMLGSKKR